MGITAREGATFFHPLPPLNHVICINWSFFMLLFVEINLELACLDYPLIFCPLLSSLVLQAFLDWIARSWQHHHEQREFRSNQYIHIEDVKIDENDKLYMGVDVSKITMNVLRRFLCHAFHQWVQEEDIWGHLAVDCWACQGKEGQQNMQRGWWFWGWWQWWWWQQRNQQESRWW